jgi:hypothetical protein
MTSTTETRTTRYAAVQIAALIAGIVFLIVGVAGFIPGLTTDMSDMKMAGPDSSPLLLGLFQVSILHNIVHLLFGVAGIVFFRTARGARNYLIWGGIVYAVILLYGIFTLGNTSANFVPVNLADNWLHLVLAVGMILLGLLLGRRVTRTRDDSTDADAVARANMR